ncbi:C40 family peptidase [Desulfobacter vibrioformis]|uniref:C40 family peptidase n=1 Tax=Desulfobacter vibrioformis TaxID=34031 RepID=UPI00054D2419|nr:C40 family peptidase [Desulfobacter vibrioformis]
MPKLTFLTRNILTFFLAVLICFGCGRPEVRIPHDSGGQSALPGKSHQPGYYNSPCPRPDPESDPEPELESELATNRSAPAPFGKKRQTIVQAARTAVGSPYFWGGLSPKGFDCSGLVVYTYAKIGIHVPRTASAQLENCTAVTRKDIKPADLIFFSVPRRRGVVHVGIYIGKGQFIHAPGRGRKVTLTSLDNVYFKKHFITAGHFLKKNAG